jgi:shikimate kinase
MRFSSCNSSGSIGGQIQLDFVFPRPRNVPLRNYFRNTGTRLTARPYTKDGNLMKLVIIYGPEASGKLTIARALAQKTGFQLFHNHVSVDVAKVLFDFGEEAFSQLIWDVRLLVFEHAARAKVPGLIFTWAYSHPDFLPYLDRIRSVMANYQVEICYVFVSCSVEELKRRVVQQDRSTVGKINSIEALERQLDKKNHQVIPDTDSLVIDNTNLSPEDVAHKIMARYHFETSQPSFE